MPGCGGSRATGTTMCPSMPAGAISTCATTTSGEFWSPSWQPTRQDVEGYTCRHGLGYTIIGSTYQGIEARTRYFVPLVEVATLAQTWRSGS